MTMHKNECGGLVLARCEMSAYSPPLPLFIIYHIFDMFFKRFAIRVHWTRAWTAGVWVARRSRWRLKGQARSSLKLRG